MINDIRPLIEQLFTKLSKHVDAADPAAADLFLPDGVFSAAGIEIAGRDAIASHVSSLSGATTRHCVVNLMLGDGDESQREVEATALILMDRDAQTAIVGADYKSVVVRTPQGWKFKRHQVTPAIRVVGAAPS